MAVAHIEFFVEEPSAEAALLNLVPKILPDVSFAIHVFQGKPDLLENLPGRLRGYSAAGALPTDYKIVVLIDEDRGDCHALKARLDAIARGAKLRPKTPGASPGRFHVLNRIAIEELEAWFFGDPAAVEKAYPRTGKTLRKQQYAHPDAIKGGTWEALERLLQKHGHHVGGLEKIRAAREISEHMTVGTSSSTSFEVFRDGLLGL